MQRVAIIATPDLNNLTWDLDNTAPLRILLASLDRDKLLFQEDLERHPFAARLVS